MPHALTDFDATIGEEEKQVRGEMATAQAMTADSAKKDPTASAALGEEVVRDSLDGLATVQEGESAEEGGEDEVEAGENLAGKGEVITDAVAPDGPRRSRYYSTVGGPRL